MISTVSNVSQMNLTEVKKAEEAAAQARKAKQDEKALREACEGFESMFLQMMYKEMRNTVPENSLLGNSNAEKIWQSMLDTEMMDNVSKSGGVGLADLMMKQLSPQVLGNGVAAPAKQNGM